MSPPALGRLESGRLEHTLFQWQPPAVHDEATDESNIHKFNAHECWGGGSTSWQDQASMGALFHEQRGHPSTLNPGTDITKYETLDSYTWEETTVACADAFTEGRV